MNHRRFIISLAFSFMLGFGAVDAMALDYNRPKLDEEYDEDEVPSYDIPENVPQTPGMPFRYLYEVQPYGESERDQEDFHCYRPRGPGIAHPGITIAAAIKSQDIEGNTLWQPIPLPAGWAVGGKVHRDLGPYKQCSPGSLPTERWRSWDPNDYWQQEVIFHHHIGIEGKTHFNLDRNITRYYGQRYNPTSSGPEGTAANSGFIADNVGTKHWNERGRVKTPVCKDDFSADDYVDFTNVNIMPIYVRYMGEPVPYEKVIVSSVSGSSLANGSNWVGETDGQGKFTVAFKNNAGQFRVGIPNRNNPAALPLPARYERPNANQIFSTIKSDPLSNTGTPQTAIIVENLRPVLSNISLGMYSNEYVYSEVTWEPLTSVPNHSYYILWSFDSAGNGISYYTTTDSIGAALIPNGGIADMIVAAYDTEGNMYAFNNTIFPAPYWPMSASTRGMAAAQTTVKQPVNLQNMEKPDAIIHSFNKETIPLSEKNEKTLDKKLEILKRTCVSCN